MAEKNDSQESTARPTVAQLRNVGLFGAVNDEALQFLIERLPIRSLDTGDEVFVEGDDGREMFLVLAGEAEVRKSTPSGTGGRIATLGAGDWFGEMSVLDIQPRSATVRVLSPAQLLCLHARDLEALYRHDLKAYVLVIQNLARELSRRLRVADGLMASLASGLDSDMGPH
ncbi:MAG: cyclic nucleotide-binding domain-containing protein [Polyangiaceae bacterium]|nr:cyclic nucleotide-binding domain-containing protein [Polyangiaceae bacterium]